MKCNSWSIGRPHKIADPWYKISRRKVVTPMSVVSCRSRMMTMATLVLPLLRVGRKNQTRWDLSFIGEAALRLKHTLGEVWSPRHDYP